MALRLREPFFSVYNELDSDQKITLNEFVSRIKQEDQSYAKVDEKKLRKIAYRQINRLEEENLLLRLSPKRDTNPEFIKILNKDSIAIPMCGCRVTPHLSLKSETSDELMDVLDHVQTQIECLQIKKTELIGEAEAYKNLSQCFPKIQDVIGEQTKKVNFKAAKINGMLNALTLTIDALRSEYEGLN
ncbi:hypothetical protein GA076_18870 [Vibrio parahaemolyticus]|uniref:hypothetical protein n=1 Tax=Vibrio harveyi group TaxID=717610 RepID=UPI000E326B61|nr:MULTISPECIES: hypothetical protein [Vibrio harveyi group]EGU9030325.1 hypothetical protein [Vibrio parahaemolyticus]EHJ9976983.1 hypothetical protein [Vibrio parahaemolyticus]EIO4608570.1 hypothetical protein [Vibrio parahaemolyticus]MCS0419327.1 hypothetical protein [Vibrio diabolicus]RFD37664.1 hypothetical protein BS586_19595 [Vibrio parahaemolyticus]